jgi:hypothetical protein
MLTKERLLEIAWMRSGRYSTSGILIQSLLAAVGLALLLGLTGCTSYPKMNLISLTPDANGFADQTTGQAFVPFGTNYYDPNAGWPPHVWSRFRPKLVKMHFKVMQGLGANCARVFLTSAFQPDPCTVDTQALKKLDTLIDFAHQSGIRLIITAPTDWEGEPNYWKPDRFSSETALKASLNLWTVLGQRYRGNPAIFAWDIANEPEMPWYLESWNPAWNAWLREKYTSRDGLKTAWGNELPDTEQWGAIAPAKDVAAAGNPRLLDWQLFREHLADEWVSKQVQTLRAADPTHLITLGYVQWSYPIVRPGEPHIYPAFNPRRQAKWLDFVSVHFYPLMGDQPFAAPAYWDQNIAYLQTVLAYCQAGKPVVLEEYGWYGGGSPQDRMYLSMTQQNTWITAEIEASRRLAQGWLSWPFADTPEATDMALFGGMVVFQETEQTVILKTWGRQFKAVASDLSRLPQPTPKLPSFDFNPSLTAPLDATMQDQQEKYGELVQATVEKAGPVSKISLVK